MPHGKITLHIDIDHEVVGNLIEEGCTTLKQALTLAVARMEAKIARMDDVDLINVNTYDVTLSVAFEDTAKGVEEVQPSYRIDLLFKDD